MPFLSGIYWICPYRSKVKQYIRRLFPYKITRNIRTINPANNPRVLIYKNILLNVLQKREPINEISAALLTPVEIRGVWYCPGYRYAVFLIKKARSAAEDHVTIKIVL
jgi:hypothetical protein